jgi:hypothetical protein
MKIVRKKRTICDSFPLLRQLVEAHGLTARTMMIPYVCRVVLDVKDAESPRLSLKQNTPLESHQGST